MKHIYGNYTYPQCLNEYNFLCAIKNTIIYFPATERPVAITVGLPIELSGKVKSSPTTVICFNKSKKFPATVIWSTGYAFLPSFI